MARLALAAVVGVAVGYFAGPVAGLQAFSVTYGVTGFLDPKQHVLGPKLSDLKGPQASLGSPICYIEGAPRLAGNYVWSSDKREIATTTSQGKGGPGVDSTLFSYEIDVLIELAINQCSAWRRIWSNGKLVASQADDATDETIAASLQTPTWRALRFYSGGPDQLPDPTYEAAVGIGNAPAYRTRTTLFIEGLNLGNSGQLPVITVEVCSESTRTYSEHLVSTLPLTTGQNPAAAGITAMAVGGFSFFYASDWNPGLATYQHYQIFDVDAKGVIVARAGGAQAMPAVAYSSLQGTSDVSVIAGYAGGVAGANIVFESGAYTYIDFAGNNQPQKLAIRSNDIVIASSAAASDKKFRRYRKTDGLLMATSAAMSQEVAWIAIGGAYVYGLAYDGSAIFQLSRSTLALVSTITTPTGTGAVNGVVVTDDDGNLFVGSAGNISQWNGSTWSLVATGLNSITNGFGTRHALIAHNGFFASQVFDNSTTGFERFYFASGRVGIVTPKLSDVVSRLCLRTGQLTAADIDVTALAGQVVRAMPVSQVSTTRSVIETLMIAYYFEFVEGAKLRAVNRGGSVALTVPYTDLGVSDDGNAEPLPRKRSNDIEVAARVSVKYMNVANDSQDGLEAADRLVTDSTSESVVELPLGFIPAEAKKLADVNTMDLATKLLQVGPIQLSRKYSALEPTDVILVTAADGSTFRTRITKTTIGGGINIHELEVDDATVINSAAATDSSYDSSTLVHIISDTQVTYLDIPILRDADNNPGLYAELSANGTWPGAEIDRSLDGSNYDKLLDTSRHGVTGACLTTLPAFYGSNVFDEVSTLSVDVGSGVLSSTTRDAMLDANANAMAVGSRGAWEIIQFRSAALVTPGIYLLSGLLRGRRGTEWAIAGHVASETAVPLDPDDLIRIADQIGDKGVTYHWKAVTLGTSRANAADQVFANQEVGLKPFAPVNLRQSYNADGKSVLSWDRRTRLSGELVSGVDVPLGEAAEAYEVEIYDSAAPTSLLATLSTSAPSVLVPAPPASFFAKVFQISAAVGRGYPLQNGIAFNGALGPTSHTPQTTLVTLGGTFAHGVRVSVLPSPTSLEPVPIYTPFYYDVASGDTTMAQVVAGLVAALRPSNMAISVDTSGLGILLVGPPGESFVTTVSAVNTGGLGPFSANVTQTAGGSLNNPQISTVTLSGTVVTGTTFKLALAGEVFSYTALSSDTDMSYIAAGLIAAANASGHAAFWAYAGIVLSNTSSAPNGTISTTGSANRGYSGPDVIVSPTITITQAVTVPAT